MMAFPPLLLAIALAAILKPGLNIVILVIALVNWVQIARVIYTETVALSEREYIEAARALGAGTGRILVRHLLPHLIPTVIVYATLGIATTVLLESMLSFLGRGVQPANAGLGMMTSRASPISSMPRGSCSYPARQSSSWRWPSISSATGCATPSTQPREGAADVWAISRAGCSPRF